MSRYDAIMAAIEAGESDEEIADKHHTDVICIAVYRKVADGTISPGSDIGRGQLTTLGQALRHVSNPDAPITLDRAKKIMKRQRAFEAKRREEVRHAKRRKGGQAGQPGRRRSEKGDRERPFDGGHAAHGAAGDAGKPAAEGEG